MTKLLRRFYSIVKHLTAVISLNYSTVDFLQVKLFQVTLKGVHVIFLGVRNFLSFLDFYMENYAHGTVYYPISTIQYRRIDLWLSEYYASKIQRRWSQLLRNCITCYFSNFFTKRLFNL